MIETLISQVVNGLVLGFVYVLIAIGLTIIFGMLGIINFAHGAFVALGAYLAISLSAHLGWWGVILGPILAGLIGIVTEVVLIRRVYGKEPLLSLIVTFGAALFIEAAIRLIWGAEGQPFSPPSFLVGVVEIGPIITTKYRMAVLCVTIVILLALWAFLRLTPYGRILRAGGRDPEMVSLLGINLPLVMTAAFGFGIALAAAAGALAAPLWSVKPNIAEAAVMPAFVTVTIGGLGSYMGAIIAGLLIGVTTALTIQFWPEASAAAMYVLMAAVLLVRPRGLFGEQWERFE